MPGDKTLRILKAALIVAGVACALFTLAVALFVGLALSWESTPADEEVFAKEVFHTYSEKPPCVIANRSDRDLEGLRLVSDRGTVELGRVRAGQTVIDPGAIPLGEIDYHFEYTFEGKQMIADHFYSGAQPMKYRLLHKFQKTSDGKYEWLVLDTSGFDGFNHVEQKEVVEKNSEGKN